LSAPLLDAHQRPWIRARRSRSPDAEALLAGGQRLDYRALGQLAERLALGLRRAGVRVGDRVAYLIESGIDAVVLFHAIDVCGATALPLGTRLVPRELALQLGCAGAGFLIHGPGELRPRAHAAAYESGRSWIAPNSRRSVLLAIDDLRGHAASDEQESKDPAAPGGHPLALLFTSGTSGRPKAVPLTHENFHASAQASQRLLGASPSDRWLACMPMHHVGGLSILTRSVLAGSSVLLHERFDAGRLDRALDEDAPTIVSLVPTMLGRLLDERGDRPAPSALRCVLLGGAPTPSSLLARARAMGFPVAPSYGLTEACSQVATRPPHEDRAPLDGRLRPLPGLELQIVDARGGPLPPGAAGEICVRGPSVMSGYHADPVASAHALRCGWLHTGDTGALDRQGGLRVFERRVDLIVSGGENVYPAEIEAVLEAHPGVAEAAVVATPDEDFGQRPLACYVAARAPAPDDAELRGFCRSRLAAFKVPVAFRVHSELPRSRSGKLLRRVLREGRTQPR